MLRRLRDLAGDRLGLALRLGAKRVGLLGRELLAVGLLVPKALHIGEEPGELGLGLVGLLRVLCRDQGLDLVVGEDQSLEDVGDILEPRGGDEALLGAPSLRR